MKHNLIKSSFKDDFYKSTMPFIYNIGAAIVILGAMFKLLNLPGGSMMLGIGLSTEAVIFLLSAFEPKEEAIDWSRVYPELTADYKDHPVASHSKRAHTITQKLDECLQQASIDAPLLDNLAASMRRFSENMSNIPSFSHMHEVTQTYISNVNQATQVMGDIAKINDSVSHTLHSFTALSSEANPTNLFSQMEAMAHTLTAMHAHYKSALAHMQEQTTSCSTLYNHLESTFKAMEVAGHEAMHFKKELASLNEKVTTLNEIYAKTLTAFKS